MPAPTPTYEVLFTRLQEIADRLEMGDLPLAESMALYEEGIQVAQACQQILDDAELRVQQLQIGATAIDVSED